MKKSTDIEIKCAFTDMMDTAELRPHPKNPNKHSPKQVALLAKIIRRLGMRSPITVSKLSGYIVAGHGRLEACKALRMPQVPVDYQDFTDEAEEMAFLMADNRIPELAELDLAMAKVNLDGIADQFNLADLGFTKTEFKDVDLQRLLEDAPDEAMAAEVRETDADIYETSIKPCKFPSSNKWDIPDIRADMIPEDFDVSGIRCNREDEIKPGMMFLWGSNKFPDDCKRGLCAFYVDDFRFEEICYEFKKMVEAGEFIKAHNFAATVGPNLSLWRDLPNTLNLYHTYLVRYVSRLWQEMGLKVIPDVNWADERSYEYCFDGIPKDAPIVSVQCRTTNSGTKLLRRVRSIF